MIAKKISSTAPLLVALLAAAPAQAAVTISSGATSNMNCAKGVCAPTAKDAVLNVAQLQSMLAASDVKVTTGAGNLASQVRDVLVTSAASWASAHSLTFDAYRSITVNRRISVAGPGALSMTTNDGGKNGELSFGSSGDVNFMGLANVLTIDGNVYTLVNSVKSLAVAANNNPSGFYALAKPYNADHDGTYAKPPLSKNFKGTFEGLGNAISFLTIQVSSGNAGLFDTIDPKGAVRNIAMLNVNVFNTSQFLNYDGGLVGANEGTIAHATVSGIVGSPVGSSAGGLVGINLGKITRGYAQGVDASGQSAAGGLVGDNEGMIAESYATGPVSQAGLAGGLAGTNSATITQCYATGSVSGGYTGGLVGWNTGSGVVEQTYATGPVTTTAEQSNGRAGGLIGSDDGMIDQGYSTGAVSGAAGTFVGGLVGASFSNQISNAYWDLDTSGVSDPAQGAGNVSNQEGITGLTTAQLQSGLPSGFSAAAWAEKPSINGGLPYLKALQPK